MSHKAIFFYHSFQNEKEFQGTLYVHPHANYTRLLNSMTTYELIVGDENNMETCQQILLKNIWAL
jgi:hypothetical protein